LIGAIDLLDLADQLLDCLGKQSHRSNGSEGMT
jgi:hypothetical protein